MGLKVLDLCVTDLLYGVGFESEVYVPNRLSWYVSIRRLMPVVDPSVHKA